jgi:hypothetical protein
LSRPTVSTGGFSVAQLSIVPFPRPLDEELAADLAAVHRAEGHTSLTEEDFPQMASVSDGMRDALMRLESCHLRGATEYVHPPQPEPVTSSQPTHADREEAALEYYGKPYSDLIPAHRAWVTMRIRGKQSMDRIPNWGRTWRKPRKPRSLKLK